MRKSRRVFTEEQKREAVEIYLSGRKKVSEVAASYGVHPQVIYKWKTDLEEKSKTLRAEDLQSDGLSPQAVKRILDLERENEELKKALGEKALMVDLLKKLRATKGSVSESDVIGLSEIIKESARSKKPAK